MNLEDEKSPKSPHKPSDSSSNSEQELQPLMDSQLFPEEISYSVSPLSASFPSPLMEFEAYSASQMFEFKPNPITERAPTGPSGGGDTGYDAEENIGVPHPLVSLQENPVPPFLSKTYDLVNDRTLDPIISWGSTGESFVVWDLVEFARIILPRNFKHNNFSSFVRQLNTYVIVISEVLIFLPPTKGHPSPLSMYWSGELHLVQGFRKIDSDKWEFANEAFRRGERHLLKNIQRRKSPQSQQVGSYTGPSTEAGKSELENEIERLRKERSMMMQEVVELQQQQHGAVHHMEAVNQRLKTAEQRQKQMVSFLAKLFQNPAFLARLSKSKEQGDIGSSRMKRKFVKHQQHEPVQFESPTEGQIVNYTSEWKNLSLPSVVPDANPVPTEQSPDYVLQGIIGMGEDAAGPTQIGNVQSDEFATPDDVAVVQGYIKSPEQFREGASNFGGGDPQFKGKNVISPQREVGPEYFVSFLENLAAEKNFPEFSSPGIESIVKQEDMWNMGFDSQDGMSSSSQELWGNFVNYDVPEFGSSGGFSDIWDLGSVQAAGSSGIHRWPADEPESHAGQPKEDRSKNIDP